MLGVKPMGDFGPEGMVTVLGKATGIEKALKVTVEYIKKTIKSEKEQIILVAHTARRKQAQTLAQLIEEKIKPKEVMVCNIYPMSGINAGPGIVAAFYYGTEITDLAYEKQILNEIIVSKS
jgi:fatty acid-binding protein DegV